MENLQIADGLNIQYFRGKRLKVIKNKQNSTDSGIRKVAGQLTKHYKAFCEREDIPIIPPYGSELGDVSRKILIVLAPPVHPQYLKLSLGPNAKLAICWSVIPSHTTSERATI